MSILDNYLRIKEIINNKINKLNLNYDIKIIAVTKTFPESYIIEAIKAGINDIGENRVQEAYEKFNKLNNLSFKKHLIGHLQSNKINKAIEIFDMIQSIDNIETALKIDKKLKEINKKMEILIQVNTSGETTKFGINPSEVENFINQLIKLDNLIIKGLMTIGPLTNDKNEIRKSFSLLYKIKENMKNKFPTINFEFLSMGMSDDFEIAIEEGSNMIRLGRILFGERQSNI